MKRIQIYIILFMVLSWMSSCDRNEVGDVEFGVRLKNDITDIHVGEEVVFLFDGNVDYITFFSGEMGNNYANISRDSADLSALQLECTIAQKYTDKEYRSREVIHAYISEDFDGNYNLENIQAATWRKISGREFNRIAVPMTEKSTSEEVSSMVDMSQYKETPFYVAFQYNAPKRVDVPTSNNSNLGQWTHAPRVDINPLSLIKTTVEGQVVTWNNPMLDWGFRVVYEKSMQKSNYLVEEGGLLFQPLAGKEYTDDDVIVWMISRLIKPWEIERDRGIAIKPTSAYLSSYSHVYTKPGTYQVTFIATNANIWDTDRAIREITLTVKE